MVKQFYFPFVAPVFLLCSEGFIERWQWMMRGAKGEISIPSHSLSSFLFCIFYGNRRARQLQPSTTWLKFPATTSNDVTYHGLSSITIHDVATSLYSITFPYHKISHDILGGAIPAVSPTPPLVFHGHSWARSSKRKGGRGGEQKCNFGPARS